MMRDQKFRFQLAILLLVFGCFTGCKDNDSCPSVENAMLMQRNSCSPGQIILRQDSSDGSLIFRGEGSSYGSSVSLIAGDEPAFITSGFFDYSESSDSEGIALSGQLITPQGTWCFGGGAFGELNEDTEDGDEVLFATAIAKVEAIGEVPVEGEVSICVGGEECGSSLQTSGFFGSLDGVDMSDLSVNSYRVIFGQGYYSTGSGYVFYVNTNRIDSDPAQVYAVVITSAESPHAGATYVANGFASDSDRDIFSSFSKISPCPSEDETPYCEIAVGCYR